MSLVIYLDNDMTIEADKVLNNVTQLNINKASAVVTVALAATSANVSGESWPLSLSYVNGSSGKYRANLSNNLVVAQNTKYIGTLIIDGGADLRGQWVLPIIVRDRRPPN